MRPIIFRGKDEKTGVWHQGGFTLDAAGHPRIITVSKDGEGLEFNKVILETVGQMWIVSRNTVFGDDLFTAECAVSGSKDKAIRVCKVDDGNEGFGVSVWFEGEWWAYSSMNFTTMKIIGNIHDNKNLING